MHRPSFLVDLDWIGSSYALLLAFAGVALLVVLLTWLGVGGWLLGLVQKGVQASINAGFRVWRLLLSWASWPVFLLLVFVLLAAGVALGAGRPAVALGAGVVLISLGVTTCLAYVYI